MAICKTTGTCRRIESNLVAIIPNTFTGAFLPIKREEIWYINAGDHYLSLTITDIDIICNRGSSLEVTTNGKTLSFCNLHRPIGAIIPRNGRLTIRFYNGQLPGTLRQDGFKATYSILKHKGHMEYMKFHIRGKHVKVNRFSLSYLNMLLI